MGDKNKKNLSLQKFPLETPVIHVPNLKECLGTMVDIFYCHPSSHIQTIGITGTNGKTSTAHYLFSLFQKLNFNVGLISTINNKINNSTYPSTHTTPDAFQINQLLSDMVKMKCEFCF